MVFTNKELFEVATESWPEWDLKSQPLNSIHTLKPTSYQAMSSTRTQSQLCAAIPISSFVQYHISIGLLPLSVITFD